jgi:hypothetical protein
MISALSYRLTKNAESFLIDTGIDGASIWSVAQDL